MDPFSLSIDELTSYLLNLGVENVDSMTADEKMNAMLALMSGEDTSSTSNSMANYVNSNTIHTQINNDTNTNINNNNTNNNDDDGFELIANNDATSHAEAISSYCSITGADAGTAQHLLEVKMIR